MCNAVLIWVLFRTGKYSCSFDFRVVEACVIVPSSDLSEVVLARGYFRGELFRFAVEPGDVWHVPLFVKGTGFVVGELVVSHNKIKHCQLYYNSLTDTWNIAPSAANSPTCSTRATSEPNATTPSSTRTDRKTPNPPSPPAIAVSSSPLSHTPISKQNSPMPKWCPSTSTRSSPTSAASSPSVHP